MEKMNWKSVINSYIKEICHYSQMQVFATSYYQKNFFQMQIDERINALIDNIIRISQKEEDGALHQAEQLPSGNRVFTLEELALYDGSDKRAAYVAVSGVVYDLSQVGAWTGGTHFGLFAGKDMTEIFMNCHNGEMVRLEGIPIVGTLNL
jgi:predicted heme/steroid binding protein